MLMKIMKNECYWCGIDLDKDGVITHLDHYIPSFMRSYLPGRLNVFETCSTCNLSKNRNFWLKTDDGVRKYKKYKQFIKFNDKGKVKEVVISHVYSYRDQHNVKLRINESGEFGEDAALYLKKLKGLDRKEE